MAAADKARYYLERSVPELQELAKKQVFSEEEITTIVKKRNDFEHILNSPGHKPNDYLQYAAYEMNLDALRKKRCQRLGVKSTSHNGARTVFFILERATRKFPGDKSLWLQYIQFCQREKANKKLARAFTSALRLRPRDWSLWVLAAKHYAEEQGDMPTARGYLQRGIRFCADEKQLYIQYAKLEMIYLAKLSARRKVLGIDSEPATEEPLTDQEKENSISLPTITGQDMLTEAAQGLEHVNGDLMKKLETAAILHGAVPVAIFDHTTKQFHNSSDLAEAFFDLTLEFDHIPAIDSIQEHILRHLEDVAGTSAELYSCKAKQALAHIPITSPAFPAALGRSLQIVRDAMSALPTTESHKLSEKVISTAVPYLKHEAQLDEGVMKVLTSTIRSHIRRLEANGSFERLLRRLGKEGREEEASRLQQYRSTNAHG